MKKIKVYSSQYSYFFGEQQIHFPYSIASIILYSKQFKEIDDNFDFQKVFLIRTNIEEDIKKCIDADILLCSCYCWNWEITTYLASEVKKINPNCLIVFGGPEVPDADRHTNFFQNYPFVDLIVHGEGEIVLNNILKVYLNKEDIYSINGTENSFKLNEPQERIKDLDVIPSPYSDYFWDFVDKETNIKYIVSWESNRGCPFSCTFCDWGSATKTKIRNFSVSKLFKEIEWMGNNNILYVDCCDGNFGIFADRDFELAKKIADTKKEKGFPDKMGITWTKGSSEKIIPLAKVLAEQNILRAVSLSVQSLDEDTLKIIKRTNIKFNKFEDLINKFEKEGIQTYTELIMGLPGETIDSFKRGWNTLAEIYPPPSIMTWNCSIFVNAPMNDKIYKEAHGIEIFKSPVFLAHTSINKKEINEYERMVKNVSSLKNGDLNKIYLYNWMMLVFHSFGLLEYIAHYFTRENNISYIKFYDYFLDYCFISNSPFYEEINRVVKHAEKGYDGKGWEHYDPQLGEIVWAIDEASFLRLVMYKDILKDKIKSFLIYLKDKLNYNEEIVNDLLNFQMFCINSPKEQLTVKEQFDFNWKSYFIDKEKLFKQEIEFIKNPLIQNKDLIEWCFQAIWWGRRQQAYKTKLKDLK